MVGGQSNSDKLKRKREEIKQRLARTFKFVEDFTSDQNINSIKTRENAVRDALDEFNKVQEQIEDNVSIAELEAQTNERIEFENIYFETMTAIATAIESYNKTKAAATNNNQNSTAIQSHQNSKINLPVIQIPEFSGHFEKWLSFRDVFQSLIHNNNNLNSIEKMHYLKSSLFGDALHTIENLAISGANYDEAWSLLEKRYGNERLIVQAHIRKILNSPTINKCTAASLRQLSDDVRSNLAALKALNRPVQHWDDILVTIIPDKLDFHSNREWQGKLGNEMPDSKTLLDFLESRYQHVASITASSANQTSQEKSGQNKSSKHQSSSNSVIINKQSCAFCKKTNHSLHQCTSFLRLSTDEKLKQVISLKLCENCLRGNHSTANCKSNNTCRDCKGRHHTLLHGTKTQINDSVPSTSTVSHCNAQHSENLLLTAVVLVKDCHEKYHQCRALLDAGSQSNFITRHLTNKLKLKTIPITHKIIGINAQPSNVTESVNISIKSICNDYGSNLNCLVLSKITGNLPLTSFSKEGLRIPQHLELADKAFNVKGPIDLLLGTGLFLSLLKDGQISLQNGHLRLQNTHLGWVLGGQLHLQGLGTVSTNNVSINMDNLNSLVGRFWEVEGYKPLCSNNLTKDEIKTENHFIQTFQKDVTGRFIVKLPSRNNVIELGDSYNLAKKRFLNLESKLIKNKQFQIDYGNFIREYRNLGHMENVPLIEINNPDCYYLPHHAVYKNSLNSKKIRVVFDARAKSNNVIVKSIQKRSFAEEYHQLSTGGGIEKNSTIRNLSPFLDENGVIRVGGRIRNANLAYNQKHSVLIPKNHNVTEAIIRHFHVKNLHSGTQSTLASIRQQYWPIAGRNKIKQIIHKCISCFRAKPIIAQQKMGDLPVKRLEPARPFINSGLDYCGPILIKTHRGRGKQKTIKAYVCLFICLSTKAIHIELVSDLTADTFLDALKRFVSRRGTVKSIISDNATNFIKANKDLIDLHQFFQNSEISRKLVTTLSNENIQWKFIPPRTPNFGGLWEAGVKSVKFHIKRVVGETVLTYDELYTLLTRIEACLNSRPLVPMSNDPNDLTAITPGHFLIGEALTAPLEPDLIELKINRLSRHQLLERLRQHFWKRWRTEYLSYLQGRTKWQSPSPSLQPGDLVLLVEDNVPPLCWPLGRIQQVHPGSDGNVRVVTVKTNRGTYKRGVRKVCSLIITILINNVAVEENFQRRFSVNVWYGIFGDRMD
jgi:hypothetical protein